MDSQIAAYHDAAQRGAEWLLGQQNPDGSYVTPALQADVYHKAVLAVALRGFHDQAQRLLNWIKATDMQATGRLRHFHDGLALYKTAWVCQGAHRLGRFDISLPVMSHILRCQAPCGGFFQTPEADQFVEPVCSAWAGVAALYAGRLDEAGRAAECMARMVAAQVDPARFYYRMTPGGDLITEGDAPFVDTAKTQQAYYCPGIAAQFLLRFHLATGEAQALGVAQDLFDFSLRCAADRYSYPTAGKSAVAAALLHLVTGDPRARDAACEFSDYMLAEQREEGWWCNPHDDGIIVRLDHTAEMVIWLTDIAGILGGMTAGERRR